MGMGCFCTSLAVTVVGVSWSLAMLAGAKCKSLPPSTKTKVLHSCCPTAHTSSEADMHMKLPQSGLNGEGPKLTRLAAASP
eukprot:3939929-Prorocentrum_lima.AAC.1